MTLYMMVGVPGSGKTTYAKKLAAETGAELISRDNIRFGMVSEGEYYFQKENDVFDAYCAFIADWLHSEHDVIADATQLSPKSRQKVISTIEKKYGIQPWAYDIVFVVMDTDLITCIERNEMREGRAVVPRSVVRRMSYQLVMPTADEFENVKEIRVIKE